MSLPGYDRWKTSPPEPRRHVCAVCGDDAYDPRDREDGPWASAIFEGVVCSPLCAFRDAMEHFRGEFDGHERVQAFREAVALDRPDAVPELVELEVHWSGERYDFHGKMAGTVVDADGERVTLEGEPFGEVSIAWGDVVDVREVAS